MSPEADRCPHCYTHDFRGVDCVVCHQPITPSQVVCHHLHPDLFFHPHCHNQVRSSLRQCTTCQVYIADGTCSACPNCGQPLKHPLCCFCQYPFSPEQEIYESRIGTHPQPRRRGGTLDLYTDLIQPGQAHRLCVEAQGGFPRYQLYQQLHHLLEAGEWQKADVETDRLIRYFAAHGPIAEFPRVELVQIDQLWLDASEGHFGLSVQSRIWQEVGGEVVRSNPAMEAEFELRVGWRKRKSLSWQQRLQLQFRAWRSGRLQPSLSRLSSRLTYDQLTFDLSAPAGHLPYPGSETSEFALGRDPQYQQDPWRVPFLAAQLPPRGVTVPQEQPEREGGMG